MLTMPIFQENAQCVTGPTEILDIRDVVMEGRTNSQLSKLHYCVRKKGRETGRCEEKENRGQGGRSSSYCPQISQKTENCSQRDVIENVDRSELSSVPFPSFHGVCGVWGPGDPWRVSNHVGIHAVCGLRDLV